MSFTMADRWRLYISIKNYGKQNEKWFQDYYSNRVNGEH